MFIEQLLQRLQSSLTPSHTTKDDIKMRMMKRISPPCALTILRKELTHDSAVKNRIWSRVSTVLEPHAALSLASLAGVLHANTTTRNTLKRRVFNTIIPVVHSHKGLSRVKWTASVAIFAIIMTMSPSLLIAPPILADAEVLLLPTRGSVSIYDAGLWYPIHDEIELQAGMRIRTDDGEATIIYRDDAIVRLDKDTIVAIHDTSEPLARAPEVIPTFSLVQGRMWMQSLVPTTSRGMTVAASYGHVTVNEGSISLKTDTDSVDVRVWDRNAIVARGDEEKMLLVGERVDLKQDAALLTKKIVDTAFEQAWVVQNLAKDAVHRRHIAHLQHERRIALAGTLPTSTLYPVKRLAEKVDVLLTFSEEGKVQKQLQQANTRLNEASAMLANGNDAAGVAGSIAEYNTILKEVASGTGSASVAQFLLQQSIAEASAGIAASQPGDNNYIIKKTVLLASADVSLDYDSAEQAEFTLLFDTLDTLKDDIAVGNIDAIASGWTGMQSSLALLQKENVAPAARLQAESMLSQLATVLSHNQNIVENLNPEMVEDIAAYAPSNNQIANNSIAVMSDEEVFRIVGAITERIYTYRMPLSRANQLRVEISALHGHPEEGRLLRALHASLPSESQLNDTVRKEIVRLRWQRAGEQTVVEAEPVGEVEEVEI